MIILSFDVSSTTVGWGCLEVINKEITLLDCGFVKPLKKQNYHIVEVLANLSREIEVLCLQYKPDVIVVEDYLKFMANRSSADTTITLGIFNRVVALQTYKTTEIKPLFLLPISIRAIIRKFLKIKNKITKQDMPALLQNYFGKESFRMEYKTKGKKKGQLIDEIYDIADGVAAGLAGAVYLKLIGIKE